MNGRDPSRPETHLGRAWDALILDQFIAPEREEEPPLLATVRDLHEQADASAPDPAFVRHLRARFASPSDQILAQRAAVNESVSRPPEPVLIVLPHSAPEPIRRRRTWLEAVAVLLIFVSLGGIWAGRDRVDSLLHGDTVVTRNLPRIPAGGSVPDVPMFQGNPQRTGDLPGPGPARAPVVLWSFPTGDNILGAPAVVDGVLYIGSADGSLYAIDAVTGAKRWTFAAGASITSSPTVMDGMVYVSAGDTAADSSVIAVDAATGQERWRRQIDGPSVSAPLAADGGLYIGSNSGMLYAFDATTGEERWTFKTGDTIWAAPSYADGTIYIESWDAHVYAVDAATGTARWTFDGGGPIWAAAPVSNGMVFIVTPNGYQPGAAQPLTLVALDATNGQPVRQTTLPSTTRDFQSEVPPVAISDGMVYLQRNQNLYAVDAASGKLRWSGASTPGEDVLMTALSGHVMYVPLTSGHLLAIDGRNGATLWDVKVSQDQLRWPVVTGGFVYVSDARGVLYALGDDPLTAPSPSAQP
ncbi:MAG TPA: PQQ-binding-like beta-propeller repeat protein [Thermomicrobiales bacterium]|nr:PQQ-binding-like beta-propeller repeat protein [Thermomicrobiales bacterium]